MKNINGRMLSNLFLLTLEINFLILLVVVGCSMHGGSDNYIFIESQGIRSITMFEVKDLSKDLVEVMNDEQESVLGGYTQAELNRASEGLRISTPAPAPYIVPILPSSSPSLDTALRSTTLLIGDNQGNTTSFGPGGFSFRSPAGNGVSFGPGGFGGSVGFRF
jgi:hypothetical protein